MGQRRRGGTHAALRKLNTENRKNKKNPNTRARAEKLIAKGANPAEFANHANWHVRAKAWVAMGKPLPESAEDREKFLRSIRVKEVSEPLAEALENVAETQEEAVA